MWFKSNLEAKTAEAFDRLGIRWEYESRCFRDYRYSGGQYTPDFWLPDAYTYVEVVGRIDDRHFFNALRFKNNHHIVFGGHTDFFGGTPSEDTPCFAFVTGDGIVKVLDCNTISEGSVFVCKDCGRIAFIDNAGTWECPHCKTYREENGCNYSLFRLAGMSA